MASTLLAYLWGVLKGKHITNLKDGPSLHLPTRTLPPELWIQVLDNAPKGTLAQVMLVNRSLSGVGEYILYRTIVFEWHTPEGHKFRNSIASCPRRGPLVLDITITLLDGMDDRLPFELPQLLMALPNLRSIRLKTCITTAVRCDSVFLNVRLSHLRSFATNIKIGSDAAFLSFLAAHTQLEALDLRLANPPDIPTTWHDPVYGGPLSRLRALSCSSCFFNSPTPALARLTHLHRTLYLASEVAHIAALLGPQLVSLLLGGRRDLGVAAAASTELRWSLGEVAARFPRLRYLQVDMSYREQPYLDTGVVDWFRPRPAAAAHGPPDPAATPAPKLTIAWTYGEMFWSGVGAAADNAFLDGAALQCLNGWRGYVERVVYERPIRPYRMVSVMLKPGSYGGEQEVVRVQDADIGWGDYWKRA